MKKIHLGLVVAVLLALAAGVSVYAVAEGMKEGKATVRSVHGKAEYYDHGNWLPVKVNMKFSPGVTIRTGGDGLVDLSVNGNFSAVRITNSSVLQIPTMSYVGSVRDGDSVTMLNLGSGTILGNVKKISANSRYEITTPHGVAGIRGTDFIVTVIKTAEGNFTVTFNSVTGVITVSAVINGQTVTRTLTTGTSWTIGENPQKMDPQQYQQLQSAINGLIQSIEATVGTSPTGGRGGSGSGGNGNSGGGGGGNGNNNNGNGGPPDIGGPGPGGSTPGGGGVGNPTQGFPGGNNGGGSGGQPGGGGNNGTGGNPSGPPAS